MQRYLVTIVSFFDVVEQPIRIECVILHSDPQKAAKEVLSQVSSLIGSCIRSVSVTVVNHSISFPLPQTLV